MSELLKSIRNTHYLLCLASLSIILLGYSSYLTRVYESAAEELAAFKTLRPGGHPNSPARGHFKIPHLSASQ
jgi:hypothetical protein